MRKDIKLTTIDANISDRQSGRRENATIAFQISYDSPYPDRAQAVVEELVSLFLQENVQARQQSTAETTAFLTQEADRVAVQIRDIETNMAGFKRRYAGRLPESSVVNMQLAERADSELQRTERERSLLQERKISLEAQLALMTPSVPALVSNGGGERSQTPAERLRALQAQYASAAAVYGADHPDIRRIQREIAALRAQTGAPPAEGDVAGKLKELEAQYAALRDRYAADHPDVQRLRRTIASLRTLGTDLEPASTAPNRRSAPDTSAKPDNPAYITLISQIESTNRELAQLSALRDDLRGKQRVYDGRMQQLPEIEREYRELSRDYDNAQVRYREVKTKQMQAQVAQELERDRKAERFSISEPANLPETPTSPNRRLVLLVGLLASVGGGIGLAWLRELTNSSVKGPLDLARISSVPILTGIPYIETRREKIGLRRQTCVLVILGAVLTIAYVVGLHLFIKPLPGVIATIMSQLPF